MAAIACFGRVQAFLLSPDTSANAGAGQSPTKRASTSSAEGSLSGLSTPPDTEKQPSMMATPATGHAIEIRQAKFGWKADVEPTLSDVTLDIPHGKLTMIVGPVASGKSTLLKAILGETPVSEGTIARSSNSIAFCDQVPWLTNETLRRNVTGFSHFDASWYTTVIRACALEDDITTFPEGDQVIIGSKGVVLSGGQKQRVVSQHVSAHGMFPYWGVGAHEISHRQSPELSTQGATSPSSMMCSAASTLRRRTESSTTFSAPLVS